MIQLRELDERVTLQSQLAQPAAPVIVVNLFTVAPEDAARFTEAWAADAAVMKRQPGFISTQLHRGIGGSGVFLNYAVWESVEQFRQAFANPEFRAGLARYPASAVASPHLFHKIPVPGICVA